MIVPHPFRLHAFERIDSTNEEARRLAADGAPEFTLVLAAEQSAGRGRRGRAWQSPAGNLYCSLLLRPGGSAADAAQLGFAASLAAAETAEHFLTFPLRPSGGRGRDPMRSIGRERWVADECWNPPPHPDPLRPQGRRGEAGAAHPTIALKWPNDVLLGGRKLAGILLESSAAGDGLDYLVIGIGMNLASHPDDTPYPATSLAAWGAQVTPEAALPILGARILAWYEAWQKGFAPLRAAWLARAGGLGAAIRVRLPDGEIEGRFDGLDEAGRLLLTTPGGRRAIAAGEVFPAA